MREPFVRATPWRSVHRARIELPYSRDRLVHHLVIQTDLVAEVIVHEREVHARGATDVAHRHVVERALRKELLAGVKEAPARRFHVAREASLRATTRRRSSRSIPHNSRLKSRVAATMVTTEKPTRYVRSAPIAPKPVSLSRMLLSACTGYVNGSTTAIDRSHDGNACCG